METRQSPRRSLNTCSMTATTSERVTESPVFCISTVTGIMHYCTNRIWPLDEDTAPEVMVLGIRPYAGRTICLFSLFELDGGLHRLAVPHHRDFDHIAHLTAAQGVSEVVKILDGLVSELDQNIAGLETSFRGW